MLLPTRARILTDAFPAGERGWPARPSTRWPRIAPGSFMAGARRILERLRLALRVPGLGSRSASYAQLAYLKLRELGRQAARGHSMGGNRTFAPGLIAVPGRHHLRHPALRRAHDGLDQNPVVLGLIGGRAGRAGRLLRDSRTGSPSQMFRISLFRIQPFTAGNLASLRSSWGRGGLMLIH